jgi:hypothetical protein
LVHTPAVFVRVANKGVTAYGTWKRIRKMGDEGSKGGTGSKGDKGTEAKKTGSVGLAGPADWSEKTTIYYITE